MNENSTHKICSSGHNVRLSKKKLHLYSFLFMFETDQVKHNVSSNFMDFKFEGKSNHASLFCHFINKDVEELSI